MAIEAGLLTCGSSYSPTPSQPSRGQWPALLAFVPAYSGASVRELHPLPVSLISIARIAIRSRRYHLAQHMSSIVLPHHDQGTGGEMVIEDDTARVIDWGTGSRRRGVSRHYTPPSIRRGKRTPRRHAGAHQERLFRSQT
jgi:hypothetical protein